ncbi:PREDICTED: ethylmalonyl-CoA decarboxylase-like isoform X2 [Nicrophorus vespilloides]|nr:PREDICTED: ethylmalonyl-CoA decarboxylase-like isoform X2 [Nicrophorus vespilloides]XP_017773682.1 PREDICTED: ethylmalonyl-CoA decarboxylase-like isoform X2 [Nicrophorus vespilloides]
MNQARNFLVKFAGGNVCLHKDSSIGVARIMLDNPQRRNAITGNMMVKLRECVEELEEWEEGKAVVLHGNGANLCSGGDLDFVKATGYPEAASIMNSWMQDTMMKLRNLPMVSVCLIQGPTLGGGAEISVYCDYILAAEDVKYGFVQGKMGIVTAWGGGTLLVQKLGRRKAMDLMLTSRILSADDCMDMDIADGVLKGPDYLGEVIEWLGPRIQHHHSITRTIKQIVASEEDLQQSLESERKAFVPFWGGELNQKALEKRIKHVQ